VKYLKRATVHNPAYIYHHLALAAVYVESRLAAPGAAGARDRRDAPMGDPMDPTYKTWAGEALAD